MDANESSSKTTAKLSYLLFNWENVWKLVKVINSYLFGSFFKLDLKFPFTVIYDLIAGRDLPGNFVRGTEMKVGTLIWWDNEPNMMEGFDVILAVADPSYGVGLLTDSPSSLRPVICEHKC